MGRVCLNRQGSFPFSAPGRLPTQHLASPRATDNDTPVLSLVFKMDLVDRINIRKLDEDHSRRKAEKMRFVEKEDAQMAVIL